MASVIEILREEHRNMGRLLDALECQVAAFERGDRPDYDVLRGIADYFFEYPGSCHHPKEDVVYEYLRERYPSRAAAVNDLPGEHRQVHERARWFRDTVHALLNDTDIARDAVVGAGRVFIETERRHMADEERQFFPLAESAFRPEDWSNIAAALARACDPVFGNRVEEEFRGLRERLLAWQDEYQSERLHAASN